VKVLYLLRHAKSSWRDPTLNDFDRPLNKRGRRAGKLMGNYLASEDLRPSLILCSAARRARQTLKRIQGSLGSNVPTLIEDGLYHADNTTLLKRLRQVDDAVPSVMLIGHNPDLEELAGILIAGGNADARQRMGARYPTAALSVLSAPLERWRDLKQRSAQLDAFVCPRDLE